MRESPGINSLSWKSNRKSERFSSPVSCWFDAGRDHKETAEETVGSRSHLQRLYGVVQTNVSGVVSACTLTLERARATLTFWKEAPAHVATCCSVLAILRQPVGDVSLQRKPAAELCAALGLRPESGIRHRNDASPRLACRLIGGIDPVCHAINVQVGCVPAGRRAALSNREQGNIHNSVCGPVLVSKSP